MFRFLFRLFSDFFVGLQKKNILFGNYYNAIFDVQFMVKINLIEIIETQDKMLISNFFMLLCLFMLLRLESFFENEVLKNRKNFKTTKLSKFYKQIADMIKDSNHFVNSMKIFILYFFVLYYPNCSKIKYIVLVEYLFTIIVLLIHLLVLKNNGKGFSYAFFTVFTLYSCFMICLFVFNYCEYFKNTYLETDEEKFRDSSIHYGIKKSLILLSPSVFKMLLALISLKDTFNNIFKAKKNKKETSAFTKISKEKFYFSILKFSSVFFKEVFLIFLIRDFLNPPNVAKFVYLFLYLYYFNSFLSISRYVAR